MPILYPITLPKNKDVEQLYLKGTNSDKNISSEVNFKIDERVDFLTYFNGFSLNKWKNYTTLTQIFINIKVEGLFELTVIGGRKNYQEVILTKTLIDEDNRILLNVEHLDFDVIGFALTCKSEQGRFIAGSYEGEFNSWRDESIRIVICTFNREEYIIKNLKHLFELIKVESWLHVTVVDNGENLILPAELKHIIKLIPNRNYGGSGGFTRGMIDTIESTEDSYILLMDDDIRFDLSSIIRTHALICGLRSEYRDSYISGAMLEIEKPTIQYENKAYWDKFRLKAIGKGRDLTDFGNLLINEEEVNTMKNQYGAWWYCCMPVNRIKQLGYPLPVFIKGDDMEFGIRNEAPLISLNGVGVWHASFASKVSPVVNYYSDRNMLIMNNYARDCNFLSFFVAVCGRFVKRCLQGNNLSLQMLAKALRDYNSGLQGITSIRADEKMKEVIQYSKEKRNIISIILEIISLSLQSFVQYDKIRKSYLQFKKEKLKDSHFWKTYLGI